MANFSAGNLYDINKQLMTDSLPLSEKELESVKRMIEKNQLKSNKDIYYMLLCHEQRDYTIFHLTSTDSKKNCTLELIECLKNRGNILSIEKTIDDQALEIWIRTVEGIFCYQMFEYTAAVIQC